LDWTIVTIQQKAKFTAKSRSALGTLSTAQKRQQKRCKGQRPLKQDC